MRCARLIHVVLMVLAVAAAAMAAPEQAATPPPATLVVANREIMVMRESLGALTPTERVRMARNRIDGIPDIELEAPITTKAVNIGPFGGLAIHVGSTYVFSVFRDDLDADQDLTLDAFTVEVVSRLRTALDARKELRSWPRLMQSSGVGAAVLVLFFLGWWLLSRIRRRVLRLFETLAERHVSRYVPQGLDLLPYVLGTSKVVLQLCYVTALTIGAYLSTTYILTRFYYTRPWGLALGSWLVFHATQFFEAALQAVPGLTMAIAIFLLARFSVQMLHKLLQRVEAGDVEVVGLYPDTVGATRTIGTAIVWLFAFVVSYPYLPGSGSEVFKGVSVFVGLIISLGSSGLAGQAMSGLALIYSRALRVGEYVRCGSAEGVVLEVGVLATKLRTPQDEIVTVPSSVLLGGAVHNYSRVLGDHVRLTTSVTIGYDAPWRQVHAMLLQAAERTPDLRRDPAPFVLQRALSDFYVEYDLVTFIDDPLKRPGILNRLHQAIVDAFNEHGVQIMSPHFEAQPEKDVLVPRDRWYAAPAKSPGKE